MAMAARVGCVTKCGKCKYGMCGREVLRVYRRPLCHAHAAAHTARRHTQKALGLPARNASRHLQIDVTLPKHRLFPQWDRLDDRHLPNLVRRDQIRYQRQPCQVRGTHGVRELVAWGESSWVHRMRGGYGVPLQLSGLRCGYDAHLLVAQRLSRRLDPHVQLCASRLRAFHHLGLHLERVEHLCAVAGEPHLKPLSGRPEQKEAQHASSQAEGGRASLLTRAMQHPPRAHLAP